MRRRMRQSKQHLQRDAAGQQSGGELCQSVVLQEPAPHIGRNREAYPANTESSSDELNCGAPMNVMPFTDRSLPAISQQRCMRVMQG